MMVTTTGTLQGADLGSVMRFGGVRYGDAPVGEQRFRPALAHRGSGDVDATGLAPMAPQPPSALESLGSSAPLPVSEDCLFLNVWQPGGARSDRPVMVWIHGGGFMTGSASTPMYDGARLAATTGAVVIGVNYRLGPLGFLDLSSLDPSYAGSGNLGLTDQILALDWVQENAAAFGGHPDRVTIFGESAGAMSVATLLAMAGDGSRFQRAIMQSGGAASVSTPERAAATTAEVLNQLDGDGLDAFLAAEPDELVRAAMVVRDGQPMVLDRIEHAGQVPGASMAFQPVVDGVVLHQRPVDAVAAGAASTIDLIAGSNADEWRLFDPSRKPMPAERLRARLLRLAGGDEDVADELAAVYGFEVDAEGMAPRIVQSDLMTDLLFTVPTVRLLEAHHRAGGHGHRYRFDWGSPVAGGLLGACHGIELPFVFGTQRLPGMASFVGEDPPGDLADRMQEAWGRFVAGDDLLVRTTEWPRFDPPEAATFHFNTVDTVVVHSADSDRLTVWDGHLDGA